MRVEASVVIERPVGTVFHFYADEHVRNHPRWNPDLELDVDSDRPIGVGTIIRRRNRMSGKLVEGTMEVLEFERDSAMAGVIREGTVEFRGGATFESLSPDRTRLTIGADMPWIADGSDVSQISMLMQRSVQNIKQLIETEV
ncbi:MAG: SRPBCC family protein [Candidatus Limnocylindria bacterium]